MLITQNRVCVCVFKYRNIDHVQLQKERDIHSNVRMPSFVILLKLLFVCVLGYERGQKSYLV